jgi:hypothetical protein
MYDTPQMVLPWEKIQNDSHHRSLLLQASVGPTRVQKQYNWFVAKCHRTGVVVVEDSGVNAPYQISRRNYPAVTAATPSVQQQQQQHHHHHHQQQQQQQQQQRKATSLLVLHAPDTLAALQDVTPKKYLQVGQRGYKHVRWQPRVWLARPGA